MKVKKKIRKEVIERVIRPGETVIFQILFTLFFASLISIPIFLNIEKNQEFELKIFLIYFAPLTIGVVLNRALKSFRLKIHTEGVKVISLISLATFLSWLFLLNQ